MEQAYTIYKNTRRLIEPCLFPPSIILSEMLLVTNDYDELISRGKALDRSKKRLVKQLIALSVQEQKQFLNNLEYIVFSGETTEKMYEAFQEFCPKWKASFEDFVVLKLALMNMEPRECGPAHFLQSLKHECSEFNLPYCIHLLDMLLHGNTVVCQNCSTSNA